MCTLGLLGGCDVTIRDGDIKNVSLNATATSEWKRHYPLAGAARVEILNNNGPIVAVAGPAGSVDIAALIEARAMTDTRAKEILSEIQFEESAATDHVRVATLRKSGRREVDVTFRVTLPPDASLDMTGSNGTLKAAGLRAHVKAMIVNGGVELTDMSGTVDAAAVNGTVSAKMNDVTGAMRLESTNGRVLLEIPASARATLNAQSVNGRITVTNLAVDTGTERRIRSLESQLNGGGPKIDIRVTNGRISITGVDAGVPTSPRSPLNPPAPPDPPAPPIPPR
jgi:hypothetical protein